mgnify:CR=1 FL=1
MRCWKSRCSIAMLELPCDDHPFESNPLEVDFRTCVRARIKCFVTLILVVYLRDMIKILS